MKLSIPAWRNDHYVSLAELLLLIGRFLTDMWWYVRVEEVAPEPGADVLEALDPAASMDIFELLHIVTPNVQIVDGEVVAKDAAEDTKPCLLLRAVDSTSWDIETEISEVVAAIRQAYPEVEEIAD